MTAMVSKIKMMLMRLKIPEEPRLIALAPLV
jgi:hypothetical protein